MDVTTVAGSSEGHQDGQGTAAKFNRPSGVACCPDGGAFVADAYGQRVRQVSAGGAVATVAGSGAAGSQVGQGAVARFNFPRHIARDAAGNIYLADQVNNMIRKTTPGGLVTTLAGTGAVGDQDGPCADATLRRPFGVAVSPTTGNIFVADWGNDKIRVIDVATNRVHTLAGGTPGFADGSGLVARFQNPRGVACDDDGSVYVADTDNHCLRKITFGVGYCTVTTLAGTGTLGHRDGAGDQAEFDSPAAAAVDGDGNVVVADWGGHTIRLVTPAGAVSTLAGTGAPGSADGQGTAASFNQPFGVAVGAAGEVLVTDFGSDRLRRIAAGLRPPALMRAPEPAVPPPLPEQARVATDLGTLLDGGEDTYHDVEFLVGGDTIRAHKGVLSARCEYFATMLGSGFAEGTGGVGGATSGGATVRAPLPVVDTTPDAFRALLRFLYTGTVDLEDESVLDVASLSQRYLVPQLQQRCAEHCQDRVSLANAVPWLVLAETHALGDLRAILLAYVAENRREIEADAPDTLAVLAAHPRLVCARFPASSPPSTKRRKPGN